MPCLGFYSLGDQSCKATLGTRSTDWPGVWLMTFNWCHSTNAWFHCASFFEHWLQTTACPRLTCQTTFSPRDIARTLFFLYRRRPCGVPFFSLPCTQDGETPVCFRYVIQPVESHVTNIFKPNPVESPEQQDWRHSTIGACFVGNMEKVIRNKRASVIWEAPSTKDFT